MSLLHIYNNIGRRNDITIFISTQLALLVSRRISKNLLLTVEKIPHDAVRRMLNFSLRTN